MRHEYTNDDHERLIEDINDYIEQTESVDEKEQYRKELNEVRDDFYTLVNSGVFHDAIGKVENIREVWGKPLVEVVTEY